MGVDFTDITAQVIQQRFDSDDPVEAWVKQAYYEMWHAADWPWKFQEKNLTVTALDSTPVWQVSTNPYPFDLTAGDTNANLLTTAVHRILQVYDDEGVELNYLRPREWNLLYKGSTDTGTPSAWTTYAAVAAPPANGEQGASMGWPSVRLGPTPDTSAVFSAYVEIKPPYSYDESHLGPYVPQEWAQTLVYGAMAIGLTVQNDPTADSLMALWQRSIAMLANATLPSSLNENRSYGGRDNYVYGS